jgi:hypothetical protein
MASAMVPSNMPSWLVPQSDDGRGDRQLARQMQHITSIAEITKCGMSGIGQVSAFAGFEVIRTLATMNLMEQAGCLSPQDRQALADLKRDLLIDIQDIARTHHDKIIEYIRTLPAEYQQSLGDRIKDLLGL